MCASTLPPPPDRRAFAAPVEWSKTCACGRVHDFDAWASLPLAGEMAGGNGERLELRTCPCKSTIAIVLCAVDGCTEPPTWTADDESLAGYCDQHCLEWLRAEESKR